LQIELQIIQKEPKNGTQTIYFKMDGNISVDTSNWEAGKDYPVWMDEISLATVSKGYLLPGETPKIAYRRVAKAAAMRLRKPELENKFYKLMWNGWLGLASPVFSNMGTDRGLPISCFGVDTPDSIRGIGLTNAEVMKLTSQGGGVGISVSRIRSRGTAITGNGKSEGVVPWCKIYDSTIIATNQGNVRRGAASVNLDINHPDIEEYLQIRRPKGDPNRQCLNLHQCVVVDDVFMRKLESRDQEAMALWAEILKSRMETGEPYIMYKDNVNKNNPIAYMMNNLDVSMTNICTEITLFTDEEHSFICCLSSLNLAKYDEWKDTDTVEMATWFLDGVMQEFIDKSNGKDSLLRTHNHAKKGRALGLGVMGWHTFLQQKGLPFNSIASTAHTHNIFSDIKNKAERASRDLAQEYGEPMWCRGTGMRNTHLLAIAPTVSNSVITGGISAGIEPLPANIYTFNGAKGTFIRKNKVLEALLESKKENKNKWWDQMLADGGSVQNLPDTVLSPDEKELFLTFPEINQLELVRQAAIRQRYLDQTQSLNLSFDPNDSPKWINQCHIEAWKLGIKTLYYLRTDSVIKGDLGSRMADCVSCDG
jgi:ribonucleoside-diphosphate reductase alpha chain